MSSRLRGSRVSHRPSKRQPRTMAEGGKNGEDIGGQLRARRAEERENHEGPDEEQPHLSSSPKEDNGPGDEYRPGKQAPEQDREEIVERAGPAVLCREKSEDVLVDEKEPEEFLLLHAHEDEPGRGDCREEQERPRRCRLLQKGQVLFGPQEKDDRRAQKHGRDGAFRQDREGEGRPGEVEEKASSFPVEFIETRKRGEEEKGKKHVDRDDAGHARRSRKKS